MMPDILIEHRKNEAPLPAWNGRAPRISRALWNPGEFPQGKGLAVLALCWRAAKSNLSPSS
jgi:hypothetical protein